MHLWLRGGVDTFRDFGTAKAIIMPRQLTQDTWVKEDTIE
jgi:hypothetical protein